MCSMVGFGCSIICVSLVGMIGCWWLWVWCWLLGLVILWIGFGIVLCLLFTILIYGWLDSMDARAAVDLGI